MKSRLSLYQQATGRSLSIISCSTATSPTLVAASRTGYLLTSYYGKNVFPHQQIIPHYRVKTGFRNKLKSSYQMQQQSKSAEEQEKALQEQEERVVEWPWYGGADPTAAAEEDIAASSNNNNNNNSQQQQGILSQPKGRNYVPLDEVFHIEYQGDQLLAGGEFLDALKHYGICVKARQAAYPVHHIEISKILIKLSRAFRLNKKPESAVANLERCLENFNESDSEHAPPCEQVCEVLLELGLAKRDLKSDEAGALFEDAARMMDEYHDYGGTHRAQRLHIRKHKKFSHNFQNKFLYFSPGDVDRTYNIVNLALIEAEDWYRNVKQDAAAVERVLQTRNNMIDRKNFNMIYQPGRVRTWRGNNTRKRMWNTSNPTATDVLAFTPTVHQVYHDYTRAKVAPLGREDEVQIAPGARYLDDGDPFRHLRAESKARKERQRAAMDYLEKRDDKIYRDNSYEGSEAVQEALKK